jgi:gliding motility-associated-like protein
LQKAVKYIQLLVTLLVCCPPLLAQYEFIENKGQWDNRIQYRAQVPAGYLHLENTGFNWFFYDDNAFGQIVRSHSGHEVDTPVPDFYKYHVLKVDFVNGNTAPAIHPTFPSQPYYNYYLGKDPEKWATGVKGYYQLDLANVWSGVDMKLYTSPNGLKYDFVLQPGSDINTVKLRYRGQDAIVLNDGKLMIKTSVNTLIEQIPEAYQYVGHKKVNVVCRYTLQNGVLGFETENYNHSLPLVIDPILIFVTYSGSTADNFGFTATYDSRGNLYAGGDITEAYPVLPNGKYPTTPGAFQQKFSGINSSNGPENNFPCDIAISKYDSSGKNLLYATYLGGTDNDYPHSLVVDNEDRLVVLGSTFSPDFPVIKTCFDTAKHGGVGSSDIILVKFSQDGKKLIGSTYIGGDDEDGVNSGALLYNYADDFRGDVLVDLRGNIFVASCSKSANFPLKKANQNTKGAGYDGVVFSLDSSLKNLLWSTFLGGKGEDALYSIKIDDNDNVITGGGTISIDLPTSANAIHPKYIGGRADGMVAVFDSSENHLLKYLTYIGSDKYDQVYFVDIDKDNQIYAAGLTEGNIPIKNATYGQAARGQFIIKMNKRLDSLEFATTIGNRIGNPDISITAFLVDNCDNIYLSGWGSDINVHNHAGTTIGLPITTTPPAIQPTTDGNDFWIGVLTPNAQSLLYATFFGGTQTDDHVDGGTSRFDKRGVIYQGICGSCPTNRSANSFVTDMPTTPNAVYQTNLSPRCSNTSLKLDFQISYAVDAKFDVTPIFGCNPMMVDLIDHSYNALHYFWDFGDGTTDTMPSPTHNYTQPGKYRIKQVISNPSACNLADSFFRTVEVIDKSAADFDFTQKDCEISQVTFENKSAQALGYLWKFGNGDSSTLTNPVHTFPASGTYTVVLVTNPGTICEDSISKIITLKDYSNSNWKFPNVFTPGDGNQLNDCFGFDGVLVDCDEVKIKIFNRWGELVYKTDSPDACWNGNHFNTGGIMPAGVYFVVAELQRRGGEKLKYDGTVTLIR